MEEKLEITKYIVGGYGPFEKWWYRVRAVAADGNYGFGFGATREAAVKRALKDLAKGGRNPVSVKHEVAVDGAPGGRNPVSIKHEVAIYSNGCPVVYDRSGRKLVLRGERWVRSGK